MATARPRKSHTPEPVKPMAAPEAENWFVRAVDEVFKFLASLRLAVMLITTLAAVLGYATFYESANGTQAVQVDIYQSVWYALLLAMLGVNILCAALIRFPWKKRQTGFVVTHAGLIILLIGAFLSIQLTDEGQLVLPEGSSTEEYYRTERPVIRVERLDSGTGKPVYAAATGFRPGAHPWDSEKLAELSKSPAYLREKYLERAGWVVIATAFLGSALLIAFRFREWAGRPLGALLLTVFLISGLVSAARAYNLPVGPKQELLSDAKSPFRLVMKDYLPNSSAPADRHEAGPNGVPMLNLAIMAQGPNQKEPIDALRGRGWLVAGKELGAGAIDLGQLAVHFQALKGPRAAEILEDFLQLPPDPLHQRLARLHYADQAGKRLVYDWILEEADGTLEGTKPVREGKTVQLPGSDINVTFLGVIPFPTSAKDWPGDLNPVFLNLLKEMSEATSARDVATAAFKVRKGDGPAVTHFGWSGMPMAPSVAPMAAGEENPKELIQVAFFDPPRITGGATNMGAQMGRIDLLATEDQRLFYRFFGREKVRGPMQIALDERIEITGGEGAPMKLSIMAKELLESGRTRRVCESVPMPSDPMRATPAALLELTVDGTSKPVWIQRNSVETVQMPGGPWRVEYDYDRGKLAFRVNLIDFDPTNDPGTTARSSYRSDVVVRELGTSPEPQLPFAKLKDGGYFTFLDRPRESFQKVGSDSYKPFDGGQPEKLENPASEVQPIPQPTKITMNNPMVRGGWAFYQSRFDTVQDQRGQPTGSFRSILSVRHDPAWPVVYGGCLLIVLGTFLQFYMRAGVFTDGGKKEREQAAKARGDVVEPEPTPQEIEI